MIVPLTTLRWRRLLALAAVVALALWGLVSAASAMLGDAPVSFSAERTLAVNGRTYVGRMFHVPGRDRHEQDLQGIPEVFLLDVAQRQAWLVLPKLHTYVDLPVPPEMAELAAADFSRDAVGTEPVDGVPTTKYRIDREVQGSGHARGFAWVSARGVLMKLELNVERARGGKPIAIRLQLSHLREGPQDISLFRLPQGFAKLPYEALLPLLGKNAL